MTTLQRPVHFVQQQIDGESILVMPLLYPEYSSLVSADKQGARIPASMREAIVKLNSELDPRELYQRALAHPPQTETIELKLDPTKIGTEELKWLEAIKLRVHFVYWTYETTTIAWIPALGIEVIRNRNMDATFLGELRTEIRSALFRAQAIRDLRPLAWLDRHGPIEVRSESIKLELLTPKQRDQRDEAQNETESTLKKIATRIDKRTAPVVYELVDQVSSLAKLLNGINRESVLIVGASGSGKTSLVHELARTKSSHQLEKIRFYETSGARIVAGMSGFGQWQERCQKMVDELKKNNGILHLGNLVELLEVGKSTSSTEGIAAYLRPFIERGQIWVTAECTSEQLSIVEQQNPRLLESFHQFQLPVPDKSMVLRIMRSVAGQQRPAGEFEIDDAALQTIYSLHRRYATYSAMPGRPIRFLRNLIADHAADSAEHSNNIDAEQTIKRFADETGLPFFLLSEREPLALKETQNWFASRVIGQQKPVDLVVDLLAAVKANLTPAGKPIASFLFIGPTGVGKTEMAKSIAEFMFSDPRRMIRFDMSEYNDPVSVQRLIGGLGQEEGLLTGKVRQNPFSVVLIDEFEKADASFFDLLLQVLGEGRLTDGKGRVTDFSTAIIIMTSNLGSESFRPTATGFQSAEVDKEPGRSAPDNHHDHFEDHFVREVQRFTRPEFFNRIDRIVPFGPLSEETVRAVVQRELDKLRQREGIWYRNIDLEFDAEAVSTIAANARDARYGARPVQRYIHDHVTVPLADRLNAHKQGNRLRARITSEDGVLHCKTVVDQAKSSTTVGSDLQSSSSIVESLRNERRRAQSLFHSPTANRIRNEAYRLDEQRLRRQKLAKRWPNDPKHQKPDPKLESEIARYARMIRQLSEVHDATCRAEDETLLAMYQKKPVASAATMRTSHRIKQSIDETLFNLFLFNSHGAETVNLLLYSRHTDLLEMMLEGYTQVARKRDFAVQLFSLLRHVPKRNETALSFCKYSAQAESAEGGYDNEPRFADLVSLTDRYALFNNPPKGLLGILIHFRGPAAFPIISHERGRHLFQTQEKRAVAIEAVGGSLKEHRLPVALEKIGPFDEIPVRRKYDLNSGKVQDSLGKTTWSFEVNANEPHLLIDAVAAQIAIGVQRGLQIHLEGVLKQWS